LEPQVWAQWAQAPKVWALSSLSQLSAQALEHSLRRLVLELPEQALSALQRPQLAWVHLARQWELWARRLVFLPNSARPEPFSPELPPQAEPCPLDAGHLQLAEANPPLLRRRSLPLLLVLAVNPRSSRHE
jgi:hypothetical protein